NRSPEKAPCHLFRTSGTAGWRACALLSGMGPYRKSRLKPDETPDLRPPERVRSHLQTLNGQRHLAPDNVARYLFEQVIPGARNANVFLENGARLYLDTGFHPEYATPECDDVAELVSHDKAGERILEDLRHQAEKRLREDELSGNILLFKNNTDSVGNSYGCHENYLVSRDVSFQR